MHERDPENFAFTTTWGGGGVGQITTTFFLKAIYLGMSFLLDNSLDLVALYDFTVIKENPIYTYKNEFRRHF